MRYRINSPQVSSETIDGETIIIDFVSGSYFSTSGIGALIWEALKNGNEPEEIYAELARRYPELKDRPTVIPDFVERLITEKLITERNDAAGTEVGPLPAFPEAYAAPELTKYTDMQDLLLLDPIHETDDQGWPVRKDPQQ